jgi:hypothetical protein
MSILTMAFAFLFGGDPAVVAPDGPECGRQWTDCDTQCLLTGLDCAKLCHDDDRACSRRCIAQTKACRAYCP